MTPGYIWNKLLLWDCVVINGGNHVHMLLTPTRLLLSCLFMALCPHGEYWFIVRRKLFIRSLNAIQQVENCTALGNHAWKLRCHLWTVSTVAIDSPKESNRVTRQNCSTPNAVRRGRVASSMEFHPDMTAKDITFILTELKRSCCLIPRGTISIADLSLLVV